jgi:TolB protein
MWKTISVLLLSLIASTSLLADEILEIRITQGIEDARPIAIVPFRFTGTNPSEQVLERIVAADLQRSGQFRPVPNARMPEFPASARDVDVTKWRNMGVEAVVTGTVTELAGGNYRVTYELVDIFQSETNNSLTVQNGNLVERTSPILLSRQATVNPNAMRMYAHQIADAVFEKLTGIRGAFATRIAYVAINTAEPNPYRLYVADSDGYAPQRLLASSEPVMAPNWSPDGRKLAYVSFENGNSEIWVQDIYTGKRESISSFKGINSAPTWSPDGQKLALSLSKDGNSEIYIYDIASKQFKRITNHRAIDTEPAWHPNGKTLLFTSDRGGRPQIYTKPIDSFSTPKRITWEGDYNAGASFSPDGKSIVMVHRNQGVYHIARQDLASGFVQVLSDTFLDESPSIAPNSSMVIYATLHQNRRVLGAVSMDGRFKARLPASRGGVRAPAWSPYLR